MGTILGFFSLSLFLRVFCFVRQSDFLCCQSFSFSPSAGEHKKRRREKKELGNVNEFFKARKKEKLLFLCCMPLVLFSNLYFCGGEGGKGGGVVIRSGSEKGIKKREKLLHECSCSLCVLFYFPSAKMNKTHHHPHT